MILSWDHYNPLFLMRFLHPPARIAFLLLISLLFFTVYSVLKSLARLRSLERIPGYADSACHALRRLEQSANSLSQLILVCFFLFGLIFCFQLPAVFILFYSSGTSRDWIHVAENIATYSEFAAEAFMVFLAIQCLQWFISSKIGSAIRRLSC
jgi:hypothetical protein